MATVWKGSWVGHIVDVGWDREAHMTMVWGREAHVGGFMACERALGATRERERSCELCVLVYQ